MTIGGNVRAYVTGATGFLGGRLARSLLADDVAVAVLARNPERAADLVGAGATVVLGDVADEPSALAVAMRGHDVVYHLAAIYEIGTRDAALMERINVGGTRNVLAAARDAGVSTVVYCSSTVALGATAPGEVGDEEKAESAGGFVTPYEATKRAAHIVAEAAADEGQDVRIACPNVVYGPGDTSENGAMLKMWAHGLLPLVPFPKAEYGYVHVDDVVDGLRAIADRGVRGRSYVLGGERTTQLGFLRAAASALGKRGPRGRPTALAKVAAPMSGPFLARFGLPRALLRESARMLDHRGWAYGSGRAERELGYTWRPLAEGMPETVAWARATPVRTPH